MVLLRSPKHLSLLSLIVVVASSTATFGDGTETLGTPSIPIETGTRIVGNGVGLVAQRGTIAIDVPAGAQVKQVLLYWNGFDAGTPTNTITLNGGTIVSGTLIGGPTLFFTAANSYSYRSDITSLDLITPGLNVVTVDGSMFSTANNGASIIAIIDEGDPDSFLGVRDGQDLAFANFSPPLDTTVAQTFTFAPEPDVRQAEVTVIAGSIQGTNSGPIRPSILRVTTGGVTTDFDNMLSSSSGDEWDHVVLSVDIPRGATTLTVQALSEDCCATTALPASLAWVAATMTLAPLPTAEIGDRVFCDLNNNGSEETGEPGQAGITVMLDCTLLDGSTLTDTQITDTDGHYLFTGIPAGATCAVTLDVSSIPPTKELGQCSTSYNSIAVGAGASFLEADFCVKLPDVAGIQNLIWIPNADDNTISVINLDGSIDGTLIAPGLVRPVAIAVKPTGSVFVAFEDSDVVAEFNPGGTIVNTWSVGDRPRALAVDSEGSLWVSNFGDSTLIKIDGDGNIVFGPGGSSGPAIPVDASPLGIGVDVLDNVYVVSQGPPSLTKLNAAGAQLATVQLPPQSDPLDLVLDRAGHAWITLPGIDAVERRASDLTLIESFPTPGASPEALAIRGAAEAWVIGSQNGQLYRLSAGGSSTSFAVGTDLGGVLIDGDGFIWVAERTTNQLLRFDGNGVASGSAFTGLAPSFLGDASGLIPANVLLPLADFDGDSFANSLEIDTFVNPLDAVQVPTQQIDFVAPVEALNCSVSSQLATISWTLPGSAAYTAIVIERDSVVVATLGGTATSWPEPATLPEGTYAYEVIGVEGTLEAANSCVVAVGAGQIDGQQTINVSGLVTNLFDITSNPAAAAGQPRFYLTDPANGKVYGTDELYNVLITLDSPFIGFAPTTGIVFVPDGNGGLGSLVLGAGPNGDPNQNATVIEIALDGTVLTGPVEITIPAQPFNGGTQLLFQKGGISSLTYREPSKVFLASSPVNCEMFSFQLNTDLPPGDPNEPEGPAGPGPTTVDLIPAASATHPQPGYGLNGVFVPEFIDYDATGGRVWVTNQAPDGSFEIRALVIANGQASFVGDAIPLAAATAENAFGGFSLSGDEFAIVGLTTSTIYELGSALFVRGDADPTGFIDVGDSIRILAACFQGQPFTSCIDAYDFDDSGTVGIGDSVALLAYLFSGGAPPTSPFPDAGEDPTPDGLPCL
ncbi:MAG: SdrD B-like domain-containing protein [Planctomycetota bacterium]